AASKQLTVGEQALGHHRRCASDKRCQRVNSGELELGTVGEVTTDAFGRVHRRSFEYRKLDCSNSASSFAARSFTHQPATRCATNRARREGSRRSDTAAPPQAAPSSASPRAPVVGAWWQ